MSTLSIILLLGLIILISYVLFKLFGPNLLFRRIDARYDVFNINHDVFTEKQLLDFKKDLEHALYQLSYTISNREHFIESNSDPEFSEFAADVPAVQESVRKDKQREQKYRTMLSEVNREILRREHSRKYK